MKKQETTAQQPGNRVILIACVLCAVLVIGIILVLVLGDRVASHHKLSGFRSELSDAVESDCTVSITQHGFFTDSIYQTATAVLEGEKAKEAVASLRLLTESLDFEERIAGHTVGIAERMISVRYGEETLILYMMKDRFYLSVGRGAYAVFSPEKDTKEAFLAFFEKTDAYLLESK